MPVYKLLVQSLSSSGSIYPGKVILYHPHNRTRLLPAPSCELLLARSGSFQCAIRRLALGLGLALALAVLCRDLLWLCGGGRLLGSLLRGDVLFGRLAESHRCGVWTYTASGVESEPRSEGLNVGSKSCSDKIQFKQNSETYFVGTEQRSCLI